jgi:hypothetical protein
VVRRIQINSKTTDIRLWQSSYQPWFLMPLSFRIQLARIALTPGALCCMIPSLELARIEQADVSNSCNNWAWDHVTNHIEALT